MELQRLIVLTTKLNQSKEDSDQVNLLIALYYENRMDSIKGYYYLNRALNVAKSANNKKLQAEAKGAFAMYYRSQKNFDSSEYYFRSSLELLKPYSWDYANTLFWLAWSQNWQGGYEDAISTFNVVLKNALALNDTNLVCGVYDGLSYNYLQTRNLKRHFPASIP
jgi:tetratricopeptide (TPR) repeat protein